MEWQPIETAPKDRPILGYIIDKQDYCDDCWNAPRHNLCLYHACAEGMDYAPTGVWPIEWGGAWDDRDYENPNDGYCPDWWYVVGSDFEKVANPTHWMPLPEPPERGEPDV